MWRYIARQAMFLYHQTKSAQTCKCMKCGLEYKKSDLHCPYCVGKSNAQIITDIHIPYSEQLKNTSSLGRQFIYLAIIICCLLFVIR
jgi:hypothetical protein